MAGESPLTSEQLGFYTKVLSAAKSKGIPFAIGGAFGLAHYTGVLRNTKDIDLYVLPEDRGRMIQLLEDQGTTDLYDKLPYDRGWIYRAAVGEMIVDTIWGFPNRVGLVDRRWFDGPKDRIGQVEVLIVPPEELIWAKLYVVQRARCDWPDILNILRSQHETLKWDHLLKRAGEDKQLLFSMLLLYFWICPGHAAGLPAEIRDRLPLEGWGDDGEARRAALLDSRPWFHITEEKC